MDHTYENDIVDVRESTVKELIDILNKNGAVLFGDDLLLQNFSEEYDITSAVTIENVEQIDETIVAVAHSDFDGLSLKTLNSIMSCPPITIYNSDTIDSKQMEKEGIIYYYGI